VELDAEFTKWIITLGVGGVLAAFMFTFYRKDVKQYTELWRQITDQLIVVVKENTASNVKLSTLLETWERNALRKSDIDSIVDKHVRQFRTEDNPSRNKQ
jgi:hypothetical protein